MALDRNNGPTDESRRGFLRTSAALAGLTLLGGTGLSTALAEAVRRPVANGERPLARYPQKRELRVLTTRPVEIETPMAVFNQGVITPNDAFFVRWHLADVPTRIDGRRFRIRIHGRVKQPLELTPAQLASDFEPVALTAVCQCSGNSRSFFEPRVAGGQWTNGAMGNAHWKGVRLRDVLDKAGLASDALQVRFNGADGPPMSQTPDFMKSLNVDMARSEDVLIAYEMNGAPLPLLNGYPVRLVVPGWYATYWVKMLADIEV
ncbi:MAG: molybdopterin-dependent oxidoreductase, partial [Nitrococcus sp.]|nr:molybdopterin-dependent oxidoreductase [Nitrococcus sp.]